MLSGPRQQFVNTSMIALFATSWTVALQAPQSMGFSRQERWSGVPFPSPGDLPDPGIEPRSPALQADALTSEPPVELGVPHFLRGWSASFSVFVLNSFQGMLMVSSGSG